MTDQQKLNNYTYQQLQSGLTPEEITQQLRGAGWNEIMIAGAFEAARTVLTPTVQPSFAPAQPTATAPTVSFVATGQKRGRIKTGWLLLRQSLKVLQSNKQLVLYPIVSGVIGLCVTIVYVLILLLSHGTFLVGNILSMDNSTPLSLTTYGMMLSVVYYVTIIFIAFTYNAALAAHVLDIFKGTSNKYTYYMQIAWSKRVPIFFYSVITMTVGFILQLIEERARWIGWIISRILGAAWTLANLFTIPIIVESDSSAPSAIKQSTKLFLSRWGESIAARITFSGIALLGYILFMILTFMITVALTVGLGPIGFLIGIVMFLVSLILFVTIKTAAENILSAALYFYAKYGQVPGAFDPALINAAFIPKKTKKRS